MVSHFVCMGRKPKLWKLKEPERAEEISRIKVSELTVSSDVASRESTDDATIERYAEILEDLPPIVVFRTDSKYLLADGFHRLAAATRRGWEYIPGVVRAGTYEDACEYAITANLKHGRPLTTREYEQALKRLRDLHPEWTQNQLGKALARSRQWVGHVLAAKSVEEVLPGSTLDTRTKAEISRAPKELWEDIGRAAQEQDWTRDETQMKVKAIKAEPSRAKEILHPPEILIPAAPADKLIPLTKEIDKLCGMLDPELYDWGTGALAHHTLQGLYVLAGKMARMIEFLESREVSR